MHFATLIFRNVIRRRGRSLLTLCALSTAVAAVVALVGIARGFTQSFADVYAAHGVDLVVSRKGAADRLSSELAASTADAVRGLAGVADAAGLLLETLSLEQAGIYAVPTMGVHTQSRLLQDYRIAAGRGFRPGDQKVVLVGVQLATRLRQPVGSSIQLFEEEAFEIVGIFESYSAWENSSMIMPLAQLQRLTDRPDQVTYINVMLDAPVTHARVEAVAARVAAMDGRLLAMPTQDFVRTDTRMQLAHGMAWMTSSIALLIGCVGLLNTMMSSVHERTREIGVLRAIGWKRHRVVGMILAEAGVLCVAAAALGACGGVLLTWGLSRVPAVAGTVSPHVQWPVVAQGLVLALVMGLLGAAYPAYQAARLLPTEALRHE